MPQIEDLLEAFDAQLPANTGLLHLTNDYLNNTGFVKNVSPRERITAYIEKLLPLELAFAHVRSNDGVGARCLPVQKRIDCLVMLQGYSWEPLLQSIAIYQPSSILMVVSETLKQPTDFTFRQAVELLATERCQYPKNIEGLSRGGSLLDSCPKFIEANDVGLDFVEERPHAVFSWIRQVLQDRRECLKNLIGCDASDSLEVLLDITGAKKSMVAGAYVYAAFSDTQVTYVDFDEYDERAGRPKGFSCRISRLVDPINAFRVKDWRSAVVQFQKFQFDAAKTLFQEIRDATLKEDDGRSELREIRLFPEQSPEQKGLNRLVQVLEMYHHWDNGDYNGALRKHEELTELFGDDTAAAQSVVPAAVEVLGPSWPDRETLNNFFELIRHTEKWSYGAESLYLDNNRLLHYAYDEQGKIERLVTLNEDFRSAYLRAHALSETLMKARLLRSWYANQLQVQFAGEGCFTREELLEQDLAESNLLAIEKQLGHFSPVQAGQLLRQGKNSRVAKLEINSKIKVEGKIQFVVPRQDKRSQPIQKMEDFYSEHRDFWIGQKDEEPFSQLRNASIHFCLSFPKTLAEKARAVLEKNLQDFENNWLERVPNSQQVNANEIKQRVGKGLNWNSLARACRLTFLPDYPEKSLAEAEENHR